VASQDRVQSLEFPGSLAIIRGTDILHRGKRLVYTVIGKLTKNKIKGMKKRHSKGKVYATRANVPSTARHSDRNSDQ
jgi:hypothetical protein